MTTYHLEHRSPSEGELYLPASLVASGSAITHVARDGFERPGYVLTEDRPKSDHPEALLIRADGTLWARINYPGGSYEYMPVPAEADGIESPTHFTEWEDVYDEVPAPEPEPKSPTADVIRITGIDPDHWHAFDVPTIAIRQHAIGTTWYRTTTGFSIAPEHITAWDDIDTGEEN